jgi:NAD(P)-dependent dehydrogenase (short-subunit alcohol dehydrogenase family)
LIINESHIDSDQYNSGRDPIMTDKVLQASPILERFRLDGRVALVTGAGSGIGRGYAYALAQAGAAVAIVDINGEAANTVAQELEDSGIESMAITSDVRKPREVKSMIQQVMDRWGKLTIGVNNAGIALWEESETHSIETWNDIIDVNLNGVFLCAQAEAKVMLEAGYGKIINTASISGHIANTPQNQTAYNTSKAAVIHLTRSLATEWAMRGVRVNSISPGYTRTKLVADLLETEEGQRILPIWMGMTPMGRMAEVTDMQGAVVYLASEVSDFMTGHDMVIDGGYCAW